MEDLRERPRKLIHKELQSQDLDTLTCEDMETISRNMHKARSSQLLPFRKDIEETHEALSAVQVLKSSRKEFGLGRNIVIFLLVNDLEKIILMFSCKTNLHCISSIDMLYVDGYSNQRRSFSTSYLQFMDTATVTMCHLYFSYWPINIKHPMSMYQDVKYRRLQNLV